MLTERLHQKIREIESTIDPTTGEYPLRSSELAPDSLRDVEDWAGSGVAGDITEEQAKAVATELSNDAYALGYRYGQSWSPIIDAMQGNEFGDYVDACIARHAE